MALQGVQGLIHCGKQHALIGIVIGLCTGATLMLAKPFNLELDALGISTIVIVFTLFGSWAGGLFGLARENYQVKRFHKDHEVGRYLIMVDFKKALETTVKEIMARQHPQAKFSGMDSTWINPFKMAIEKAN